MTEDRTSNVARISMHVSVVSLVAGAIIVGSYMTKVNAQESEQERSEQRISKLETDYNDLRVRIERIDQNTQWLVQEKKEGESYGRSRRN